MNLPKIIAELQGERQRLDEAIVALERLSASDKKSRGRPTGWLREQTDGQSDGGASKEVDEYVPKPG